MIKIRPIIFRVINAIKLAKIRKRGNIVELDSRDLWRIKFKDQKAKGCIVKIGKLTPGRGILDIRLCCDNSRVTIADRVHVAHNLDIFIGGIHHARNVEVSIGANTSFERTKIMMVNSNSRLAIGEECMFSYDIILHNTDVHPIYDKASGRLLNYVDELSIGNHVWVGAKVTMLKNTHIPDGSIVGWGSVVSGEFTEPNKVIAGNPARVMTKPGREVDWKAQDSKYFENIK